MDGEVFKPDTDFTDVFLFHLFDHDFQNALFSFSVMIEDYFKNILSYVISKDFGVDQQEYLNLYHYLPPKSMRMRYPLRRDIILPSLTSIAEKSLDNPTRYYRLHHNHIPPWILLKNTSFSLSTNLFQLMKRPQKQEILDFMIPINREPQNRYPVLLYTLTLVRRCRNTIAHNLKFTSFDCKRYMKDLDKRTLRLFIPPSLLTDEELSCYLYLNGAYGYIILSLSLVPNQMTKRLMINQLLATMLLDCPSKNSNLLRDNIRSQYFSGLHLPPDLRSRLLAYQKTLEKH